MRDGSDAIADWPILNALVNVAAGATWVSVHHGGGVGIGNSIHAGMVVVADGTDEMAERLERVLTTDPGTGVMRHLDAGYDEALERPPRARPRAADAVRRRRVSPSRRAGAAARPRPRAARDARRQRRRRSAGARSATSRSSRTRTSCARTAGSPRSAGCATSSRSTATSRSSTAAGCCAVPGLVDCHTHACFAGDRVEEFALRAARRELRGAARGRRRHPLDRRATRAAGEDGLARRRAPARGLDARARARRRSRPSRATASTARRSSRRCARSAPRAASRRGSARTPSRPSSTTPTRTSTSRSPRCCPKRRGSPRRPTSSSSAARSTRRRRAATSRRAATPASRCASTATSSPRRARSRSRSSSARARSTTSRRPATRASRALAASDVVGVLLPASALFLGRPMPPARALVDAGAAVALATDFNPGSAFCESLPLVLLARVHAAPALARGGARRVHGQRGARPRARGPHGPARAGLSTRTSCCSTRRTGATSRTTSAARSSPATIAPAASRGARLDAVPTRKQRRRAQKERRHEYEYVYVDEEGHEVEVDEEPSPRERPSKRTGRAAAEDARGGRRGQAAVVEPRRQARR